MSEASAELSAFDASDIARVIAAFTEGLRTHRVVLNRLNVFPVPDGDTGTNMLRTLESVESELAEHAVGSAATLEEVLLAIGHGSLMGARGNSGVILSQVLRGISDALARCTTIGSHDLARAFDDASVAAREAVLRPVEGTILTVADGAASAAGEVAAAGGDLAQVCLAARDGAQRALWTTPDLLPVLKQAGVVDAGGAGLTVLYESFVEVATGSSPPDALALPPVVAELVAQGAPSVEDVPHGVGDLASLRYEVMFLLDADDHDVATFRDHWGEIGDSIVVVGGDRLFNCHIHTDDIGAAIEAAIAIGRPRDIRVTDLLEQSGLLEAPDGGAPDIGATDRGGPVADAFGLPPTTAVVAVGTGRGLERIFRSLGVAKVIAGGQSMNPSTAEILDGLSSVVGRDVIVLPNNGNIVAVAEQAAKLADRAVLVIPTRSIPEGLAALIAYDPAVGGRESAQVMAEAAARVVTGEVTCAVRDAATPVGPVRTGEWIGVSTSGIVAVAPTLVEATQALIACLVAKDHEIITIIVGEGAERRDVEVVTQWIATEHGGLALEVHEGGQPLYPFLVAIE